MGKNDYKKNDSSESFNISEISKVGYQYIKLNKLDEAITCFTKILSVEANNNFALIGLGDIARKQGKIEEAIGLYQKCLLNNPENNFALFGLADCYKYLGQYQDALKTWEQYLQYDEKNVAVLTRVGDAYRKIRNFENSKFYYLKALEIEENNQYAINFSRKLHSWNSHGNDNRTGENRKNFYFTPSTHFKMMMYRCHLKNTLTLG